MSELRDEKEEIVSENPPPNPLRQAVFFREDVRSHGNSKESHRR